MAKSVIGADRNHVIVADMEDVGVLAKRIAALEALARGLEEPKPVAQTEDTGGSQD